MNSWREFVGALPSYDEIDVRAKKLERTSPWLRRLAGCKPVPVEDLQNQGGADERHDSRH